MLVTFSMSQRRHEINAVWSQRCTASAAAGVMVSSVSSVSAMLERYSCTLSACVAQKKRWR